VWRRIVWVLPPLRAKSQPTAGEVKLAPVQTQRHVPFGIVLGTLSGGVMFRQWMKSVVRETSLHPVFGFAVAATPTPWPT
jgi:hypothetical protein